MATKMIKEGLLIPKEDLKDFGEVEMVKKRYEITIKPKNLTRKTAGILKSKWADVLKLHKEYEITGGGELLGIE